MSAAAAAAAVKRRRVERRVGIVGYGKLGRYLAKAVLDSAALQLAFVWNRDPAKVLADEAVKAYALDDLSKAASRSPDLIVEVAHPDITREYGVQLLALADYMVGSPTIFADAAVEAAMREAAALPDANGLYIPSGAFWGASDVQKMADRGSLKGLTVTMCKHPSSFRLNGELVAKNEGAKETDKAVVLYEGPVRQLCPLAPNNVNTMACAALAGHNLGFDQVQGRLVSDSKLDAHIIEIQVTGPGDEGATPFNIHTVRHNPAKIGAVTGNATYEAFWSSTLRSQGHGNGVHFV